MVFGFIKDAFNDLTKGVRGVGRLFRGKFSEGLGDIGSAASVAAPFLPGGGLAKAGVAGLGALMGGKGLGTAATRAVTAGRGGNVQSILGRIFGGGGGGMQTPMSPMGYGTNGGGGGLGGILDAIGGGNRMQALLRLGGLGLAGYQMHDSSKRRASSEAFNQQRLDMLMAALGRSEEDMDRNREASTAANAALQEALRRPGILTSQLR